MKTLIAVVLGIATLSLGVAGVASSKLKGIPPDGPDPRSPKRPDKVVHTEAVWKLLLTPEQFDVLRKEGTERSCSGKFWDNHKVGIYYCAGCGLPLFSSNAKFDSGTGWPSFFQPISKNAIWERPDHSFGMDRTEVLCARCDGHLGHVFNDGPSDKTGLRFCMNSAAFTFKEKKKK